MDPDSYLRRHHLLTYVEDAVLLLLSCKDEVSKTRPFELLADYFKSVRNGSHVVFREYNFISATPHNRKSFISTFWQTYSHISECQPPMQLIELHSLLRLLCADFPLRETEKVSRVLCNQIGSSTRGTSLTEFSYVFQITFYFDRFVGLLEGMLPSLLSGTPLYPQLSSGNTVVVPLPTATNTAIASLQDVSLSCQSFEDSAKTDEGLFGKAVSSRVLLEAALGLCQRMEEREPGQSCPSQEALREVLSEAAEEMSLRNFLCRLSESDRLNCEIGVLPSRT